MKTRKWGIIMIAGLCLLAWNLQAMKIVIDRNNQRRSVLSRGDEIQVMADGCDLTILGDCQKLSVIGDNNIIRIQAVFSIYVPGDENTIYVKAADYISTPGDDNHMIWELGRQLSKPSLTNQGDNNTIEPGAVDMEQLVIEGRRESGGKTVADDLQKAADILQQLQGDKGTIGTVGSEGAKQIVINQNYLNKTIECNGQVVIINGNFNELELTGFCRKVRVNGTTNTVRIEAVGAIEANGPGNTIFWRRGLNGQNPTISNPLSSNQISQMEE